jgi:hypothetical protein
MVVSNRAPPRTGPGPQAPVRGPAVRSGPPARCPLLASGDRAMACVTGAIPGGPRNLAVRHARGGVALVVPLPDASNAQHVVELYTFLFIILTILIQLTVELEKIAEKSRSRKVARHLRVQKKVKLLDGGLGGEGLNDKIHGSQK